MNDRSLGSTRRATSRLVPCDHASSLQYFICSSLPRSSVFSFLSGASARAQELGGAGTLQGTVKDPTGGVMVSASVSLSNPVSGFRRDSTTDEGGTIQSSGTYPPIRITSRSPRRDSSRSRRDVEVRSSVPVEHDVDDGACRRVQHGRSRRARPRPARATIRRPTSTSIRAASPGFPLESSSGLNQVITLASPGVVADANGFFHPIGDHAQTQFSIDNQPVTDQQSRIYSNQISPEAVQSMEIITGVPPAEFGDKDSLVVRIVTQIRARPAQADRHHVGRTTGRSTARRRTSTSAAAAIGVGDFVSFSAMRSDRYLDPPEFEDAAR